MRAATPFNYGPRATIDWLKGGGQRKGRGGGGSAVVTRMWRRPSRSRVGTFFFSFTLSWSIHFRVRSSKISARGQGGGARIGEGERHTTCRGENGPGYFQLFFACCRSRGGVRPPLGKRRTKPQSRGLASGRCHDDLRLLR